jgi:hypothetical protein
LEGGAAGASPGPGSDGAAPWASARPAAPRRAEDSMSVPWRRKTPTRGTGGSPLAGGGAASRGLARDNAAIPGRPGATSPELPGQHARPPRAAFVPVRSRRPTTPSERTSTGAHEKQRRAPGVYCRSATMTKYRRRTPPHERFSSSTDQSETARAVHRRHRRRGVRRRCSPPGAENGCLDEPQERAAFFDLWLDLEREHDDEGALPRER